MVIYITQTLQTCCNEKYHAGNDKHCNLQATDREQGLMIAMLLLLGW